MRSEQQMMDLILGTARNDDRIRAVIMNGSRANPNAKRDFFQDFDIVYVVRDIDTFTSDHGWVGIFGDLMIMQMPKLMRIIPDVEDGSFTYLMQFTDGNRIDLSLVPADKADEIIERDSQSILLLDKDGLIEPFPPASEADYIIKRPTAQLFADCCNEFWWICTYVAKGIWRRELPYAMFMHDRFLRDMLDRMLAWHIGIRTDFSSNAGKFGKHFERYLETGMWDMYVATYARGDYDDLWRALFTAGGLFRQAALEVAARFGFSYPSGDDERVTAHLEHVRQLPRDAAELYPG